MSSPDSSHYTLTRYRRRWFVGNRHDPNDSFEVKAVTYRDALVTALNELGWVVVFESQEDAERAIYLASDQPTTCPNCGARTACKQLSADRQEHTCVACSKLFFVEFEDEEEDEEDVDDHD